MSQSHSKQATLLVSSKGRVVLPAALRRRLGIAAGTRLQVTEESGGLKLQITRSAVSASLGMGIPRRA